MPEDTLLIGDGACSAIVGCLFGGSMGEDELNLESEKLRLEREKFEFERLKFEADESKRKSEARKLDADSAKAELEADDLRVPYTKRPAYRTVVFQGVALVLAVASALISTGAIKSVLDANKAEYASALAAASSHQAESEKADADQRRAEAEKAKALADEAKKGAEGELKELQLKIVPLERQYAETSHDRDVALAELQGAHRSVSIAPLQEILSKPPLDISLLTKILATEDIRDKPERAAFAEAFAQRDEPPLDDRVQVLATLYNVERQRPKPDILKLRDYRIQLLAVAAPPQHNAHNSDNWFFLMTSLGPDVSAPYICPAYVRFRQKMEYIPRDEAFFIYKAFWNQPACLDALWDALDPRFVVPGAYDLPDASEVALFRCANGSCIDGGRTPAAIYVGRLHDPPDDLKNPMMQQGLRLDDGWREVRGWVMKHPILQKTFNESGLRRLRTCSMTVFLQVHDGNYIDEQQLNKDCSGP